MGPDRGYPEDTLREMAAPACLKPELVSGSIFLSPQGAVHSEIILTAQEAGRAAGLPRWRCPSRVLSRFPGEQNAFCPDVALLRRGARRVVQRRDSSDIAAVVEVAAESRTAWDFWGKDRVYAAAGVDAYLIAEPYEAVCILRSGPEGGAYPEPEVLPFGETVRFTADGTEFVVETSGWPTIARSRSRS